jgi:transcription elongation factor
MDDLQQLSNHEQEVLQKKMDRPAYYKNEDWDETLELRVFPLNEKEIFLSVRTGSLQAKFNIKKEDALDLAERLIYAVKYQSL